MDRRGQKYNYTVEINDGIGYEEREYDIMILEHGISDEDIDNIETLILKQFKNKELKFV